MQPTLTIGIFGNSKDIHCQAIGREIEARGHRSIFVDALAFSRGVPQAIDDEGIWYAGTNLSTVSAWCLRYILLPIPRSYKREDEYLLFKDWWVDFMHEREAFAYQLSLLLKFENMGIPVVNPAEHGSVIQLKALQLHHARALGLRTPRTLMTNDPKAILRFAEGAGDIVYKPSLGGGLCKPFTADDHSRLHLLAASPVTFQERIQGDVCRLTFVGGTLVSSVAVESEALDYRADPNYRNGGAGYKEVAVPEPVIRRCAELLSRCGLTFSGVDLIRKADGEFIFLEANSSPAFLDIETKMEHPIAAHLVDYLISRARTANGLRKEEAAHQRTRESFVSYALPIGSNSFT
jgi:hypothetical protein